MAEKWLSRDSARTMTTKYNKTTEEVNELKKTAESVNPAVNRKLEELSEAIKNKATTKADIGLGNVDNTSDIDKPVSTLQSKAIEFAVSDMVTSEPVEEIAGTATEFNFKISVVGSKIVFTN